VSLPNGTFGDGVQVQTVQRLSVGFVQQQLVSDDSGFNRIDTFQTYAAQADGLLSGANAGLAQPLQQFFTALNTLSASPTGGTSDIRVRQRFNATFTIEGYGGAATNDAAVQAYLAGLNTHSGGGAATVAADHASTGFGTIAAVPEPPLP